MFDTINQAFEYLNNFNELKVAYYLTEICKKCRPFGITNLKTLNLFIEFDENLIIVMI